MVKLTSLLAFTGLFFAAQTIAGKSQTTKTSLSTSTHATKTTSVAAKHTTTTKSTKRTTRRTTTVAPAPAPVEDCDSFEITYPTKTGLKWTDNTCYKFKYEVKKSRPSDSMLYLSLMRANGEYVATLINGKKTSKTGESVPFNLYLGAHPATGDYYLSAKFSNGKSCSPKNSPLIHVTHKETKKYPKCK